MCKFVKRFKNPALYPLSYVPKDGGIRTRDLLIPSECMLPQ